MDRMILVKFVFIILSFIASVPATNDIGIIKGQSLCHEYMHVSCSTYTSVIVAVVDHGYCEGHADAQCYAYIENVSSCKSQFLALKSKSDEKVCVDSDSISDCMADTMVQLFTSASVFLKCRNGAGSVSATAIAYACIFARDYAEMIASSKDENNVNEIARIILTSYSDAHCALKTTGYGECNASSEGYVSNYRDNLRKETRRILHCENPDDIEYTKASP